MELIKQSICIVIVKFIAWSIVCVWIIKSKYRYFASGQFAYEVRESRKARRALKEIREVEKKSIPDKPSPPPRPPKLKGSIPQRIDDRLVFARQLEIIDPPHLLVECKSTPEKIVYPDGLAIYRDKVSSEEWGKHVNSVEINKEEDKPSRPPESVKRPDITIM